MNKGNPNQMLAAVWIAGVFKDFLQNASTVETKEQYHEALASARDALKQFDAIMGDDLRIAENLSKLQLPFDVRF